MYDIRNYTSSIARGSNMLSRFVSADCNLNTNQIALFVERRSEAGAKIIHHHGHHEN